MRLLFTFFILKSPSNCHLRPGNTVWHTNDRPSDEFTTWPQGHVLQQRFWREWPCAPLHALHARLLHHAAWPSGTRRPQTDLEANRVYFRIQNFHLWDCTVWVTHTGSLIKGTGRIVKIIPHYRNNIGGAIEMKSNGNEECVMKIWGQGKVSRGMQHTVCSYDDILSVVLLLVLFRYRGIDSKNYFALILVNRAQFLSPVIKCSRVRFVVFNRKFLFTSSFYTLLCAQKVWEFAKGLPNFSLFLWQPHFRNPWYYRSFCNTWKATRRMRPKDLRGLESW